MPRQTHRRHLARRHHALRPRGTTPWPT